MCAVPDIEVDGGPFPLGTQNKGLAFANPRAITGTTPAVARPWSLLFIEWSAEADTLLKSFVASYGERQEGEPKRLDKALLVQRKQGGFDMLRDLHYLWLLVNESMMSLTRTLRAKAAPLTSLFSAANATGLAQFWVGLTVHADDPDVEGG